jgi:hypothetical protein
MRVIRDDLLRPDKTGYTGSPRHLLRLYAACARLIWNSYAVSPTFAGSRGIPLNLAPP